MIAFIHNEARFNFFYESNKALKKTERVQTQKRKNNESHSFYTAANTSKCLTESEEKS